MTTRISPMSTLTYPNTWAGSRKFWWKKLVNSKNSISFSLIMELSIVLKSKAMISRLCVVVFTFSLQLLSNMQSLKNVKSWNFPEAKTLHPGLDRQVKTFSSSSVMRKDWGGVTGFGFKSCLWTQNFKVGCREIFKALPGCPWATPSTYKRSAHASKAAHSLRHISLNGCARVLCVHVKKPYKSCV